MATGRELGARPAGWSGEQSPFHAGEQAVQERVGVRARIEQVGRRIIRDFMTDEQRELFEKLPFVVVGSLDEARRPWASLVLGAPGFMAAPSERSLVVRAPALPGDPLGEALRPGAPLGLLGIELPTRRRNRENGKVARVLGPDEGGGFEVAIAQSFGNCKQYIQVRAVPGATRAPGVGPPAPERAALSARAREILRRCDTAFIATASGRPEAGGGEGVDVSHRGGMPGFIRVEARRAGGSGGAGGRQAAGASVLTLPDFFGNFMFNTFGNLEVNPRAGFLAWDFDSGDVLSVTGQARVIWDGEELRAFDGAERLLELTVEAGLLWRGASAPGFSPPRFSPDLRATGTWP